MSDDIKVLARINELKATNGILVDALHTINALLLAGDSHALLLARNAATQALAYVYRKEKESK